MKTIRRRLHQKIISVGSHARTLGQPKRELKKKGYAAIFARVTFGCGDEIRGARTKIIIAMSKRAGVLEGGGEQRNPRSDNPGATASKRAPPPYRAWAQLSVFQDPRIYRGNPTPFTLHPRVCIPYAYPVQLQQLVTEPRQGSLPCILHASLHVLVVHIT